MTTTLKSETLRVAREQIKRRSPRRFFFVPLFAGALVLALGLHTSTTVDAFFCALAGLLTGWYYLIGLKAYDISQRFVLGKPAPSRVVERVGDELRFKSVAAAHGMFICAVIAAVSVASSGAAGWWDRIATVAVTVLWAHLCEVVRLASSPFATLVNIFGAEAGEQIDAEEKDTAQAQVGLGAALSESFDVIGKSFDAVSKGCEKFMNDLSFVFFGKE